MAFQNHYDNAKSEAEGICMKKVKKSLKTQDPKPENSFS
jgi:hypothetical protein